MSNRDPSWSQRGLFIESDWPKNARLSNSRAGSSALRADAYRGLAAYREFAYCSWLSANALGTRSSG